MDSDSIKKNHIIILIMKLIIIYLTVSWADLKDKITLTIICMIREKLLLIWKIINMILLISMRLLNMLEAETNSNFSDSKKHLVKEIASDLKIKN
jgi:hypothetical protein